MSAVTGMVIILFVFFLIGITVGIIAVIAISARRPAQVASGRADPPSTGADDHRILQG